MNAPVRKIITAGLAGGLGLVGLGIGASAAGVGRTDGSTRPAVTAPTSFSHSNLATPRPESGNIPHATRQGPGTAHGIENFAEMQADHSLSAMHHAFGPVPATAAGPSQDMMHGHSQSTGAAGPVGMGGHMTGGR
jgi:hypothetical protein